MKKIILLSLLIAGNTWADVTGEVGVGLSFYSGDESTETSYRLTAGWDDVYLFGGWEQPDARVLGQPMADVDILSFGAGARHRWGKVYAFIEGGWGAVDDSLNDLIVSEIAYTHLVNRHFNPGRPIPVTPSYAKEGLYASEYSIDDDFIGRIGVGYQLMEHVRVQASYRWFQPDEYMAIWDEESRANGGGWWEETNSKDYNAFELTILVNL